MLENNDIVTADHGDTLSLATIITIDNIPAIAYDVPTMHKQ